MKRFKPLKWLFLLALCAGLSAGCSGSSGDGGGAGPAEGSTWDKMEWDKGKWG